MSFFEKLFEKFKRTPGSQDTRPSASNDEEDSSAFVSPFKMDPRYVRAFRKEDPKLLTKDQERWVFARRRVMAHLIEIATSGPWVDYLVLRGSLSLKSCLGEEAREPGDIDWVIQPSKLLMDHPEAQQMMNSVIRDVTANPVCGDACIDHENIHRTDIWDYHKSPGRRVAFPWKCGDLRTVPIQMDFVFNQPLHTPTITQEIKFDNGAGTGTRVAMASLEESLAWKIRWLINDKYPQGKDLYDAVLLAERTALPLPLLKSVLEDEDGWIGDAIQYEFPFSGHDLNDVEWWEFRRSCPWVQGTVQDWHNRLLKALRPTIEQIKTEGRIQE